MVDRLPIPLQNLEHDLSDYLKEEEPSAPFDVSTVATVVAKVQQAPMDSKKKTGPAQISSPSTPAAGSPSSRRGSEAIPELEPFGLGPKLASSRVIEVTESEAAFPVSVVKHLYPAHLVLQFTVINTLEEAFLKNVSIAVSTKSGKYHSSSQR